MRLKRFLIGALVAGSLLGSAVGVDAAAAIGGPADCVGQVASNVSQFAPGLGGDAVSDFAQFAPGAVGQVARAHVCEGL